jgi:hypothetical protein
MTLTGINSYSGTKTMTYSIVGSKIDKAVITGFEKSLPYTGEAIEQNIDIYKDKSKSEESKLKEGNDYILSYEKNTDVGTAVMYIKGVNGYSGTVKKTFRITPYNIANEKIDQFTITLDSEEYAYAKAGAKPVPAVKFKDKILAEGKDYKLSYANNTALNDLSGTKKPTVKITGKGNFKGLDQSAVFAIVPVSMKEAAAGIRVNVNDMTEQSKADKWKAKVTVTDKDGKTLKAGTDYEKVIVYKDSATDEEIPSGTILSAGKTVKVVITGKGAYKDSATGEYKIVEAGHDISKLTATVAPKSYTGEAVKLSDSDITWKSGKNVKDDVTIVIDETTYKNNIKNGKATVTVYGTGEYGGKKTITYSIGKRSLKWWWTGLFK